HKLNIRDKCLPVRQKKRGQAPERNKAIRRSGKASGRRHYEGSSLSQLAVQPNNGEKAWR
nr:hypothetical protein [Tanacetum cinerariifolium]